MNIEEKRKFYIVGVRGMTAGELHKIKDLYIDFGKFYAGTKKVSIKSENPDRSRNRVFS